MFRRLAQVAVVDMACLLAGQLQANAQDSEPGNVPEAHSDLQCPPPPAAANVPSSPEISIVEVDFSGPLELPASDQEQIAASVKQQNYGNSFDGVVDDALERVKSGWMNHGYFKVQVSGEAKLLLASGAVGQRFVLNVHLDEGLQYRLGEITFEGNRGIRDLGVLRGLFPIKNGDIFSREKIATGLENLRNAYGQMGYPNFTSIPNTSFDDEKQLISLQIDVDEGKQFHVSSVNISGLDESTQNELLKEFPIKPGEIYDAGLFQLFIRRNVSRFSPMVVTDRSVLDEKAGTVALAVNFRACSD